MKIVQLIFNECFRKIFCIKGDRFGILASSNAIEYTIINQPRWELIIAEFTEPQTPRESHAVKLQTQSVRAREICHPRIPVWPLQLRIIEINERYEFIWGASRVFCRVKSIPLIADTVQPAIILISQFQYYDLNDISRTKF